jgi:hypothetical protein
MNTKAILSVLALLAIAFTVVPNPCLSAVPSLINYQGVLKDSTGVPYHGPATMIFSIWDDSTEGNKLWEETHPVVEVSHGLFNVLLGSIDNPIPDSVFEQPNAWLDVLVNGSQLSPRGRIASVGYAFSDGDWTIDGNNTYREQGNVGIGTTEPGHKLQVLGDDQTLVSLKSPNWDPNEFLSINWRAAIDYEADMARIGVQANSDHSADMYLYTRETNPTVLTARMMIDGSTGNVGIGAGPPGAQLEVYKPTGHGSNSIRIISDQPSVQMADANSPNTAWEMNDENGDLNFRSSNDDFSILNKRVVFKHDGNVGIGTTSPEAPFHVAANWDVGLRLGDGNQGYMQIGEAKLRVDGSGLYDNDLQFTDTNDSIKMKIEMDTGNVGIGTTDPQYKLDVEGDVQAHAYHTGDIFFQKDKEKLWRMFEDEDGLYLENLKTGKVYRFVLQEVEKE